MRVKIEYNDNLNCLCENIRSALEPITFNELLQYAIDYKCFKELYINLNMLEILRKEKNEELKIRMAESKKDIL